MKNLLKYLLFAIICCNFVLTVACQTKEQSVDAVVRECQQFLDKDDLDGASTCFQKAILSNPANSEQISKAGQSAIFKKCADFNGEKEFEKAIPCLEGLIELKTDSANAYFLLADSYYEYDKIKNYGDFDLLNRAEDAVKKGLQISPKNAVARSLYGAILLQKGDIQSSLKENMKAVEIEPETRIFWIDLGMTQEKANDFAGAIKSYEKALNLKHNDTLMLYFLGKLYEKTGENDKAIEAYEKLLKLESNPDDAEQRLKLLKEKRDSEKPKSKTKSVGN